MTDYTLQQKKQMLFSLEAGRVPTVDERAMPSVDHHNLRTALRANAESDFGLAVTAAQIEDIERVWRVFGKAAVAHMQAGYKTCPCCGKVSEGDHLRFDAMSEALTKALNTFLLDTTAMPTHESAANWGRIETIRVMQETIKRWKR